MSNKAKFYIFDAFGERIATVNQDEAARYTDHEYDTFTGWNYMKARFSTPAAAGKFNRPDPARDWDWTTPGSLNLYQYVRNNPITGYDPTGLKWFYLDEYNEDGEYLGKSWQYLKNVQEISVVNYETNEEGEFTGFTNDLIQGLDKLIAFDGDNLTWHDENGQSFVFPAVSGKIRDVAIFLENGSEIPKKGNHPDRQWEEGKGPIPEGKYSVDPKNIQRWESLSRVNRYASIASPAIAIFYRKVGAWPGGPYAWGKTRTPILPKSVINPTTGVERNNFFIHGGSDPGSAGCIDLTSCNKSFFEKLQVENNPVPLFVKYKKDK